MSFIVSPLVESDLLIIAFLHLTLIQIVPVV